MYYHQKSTFEMTTDFYSLMGGMDVCIPAFAESGYLQNQGSSTFAMAVECNVRQNTSSPCGVFRLYVKFYIPPARFPFLSQDALEHRTLTSTRTDWLLHGQQLCAKLLLSEPSAVGMPQIS
jgi:hypothetical protein